MSIIPNNIKVVVTADNGQEFKGTVTASGEQAKVLMYAVLLDNPENYPGIETGLKIVEVPYTQVKLDISALIGKEYSVSTAPLRFML